MNFSELSDVNLNFEIVLEWDQSSVAWNMPFINKF